MVLHLWCITGGKKRYGTKVQSKNGTNHVHEYKTSATVYQVNDSEFYQTRCAQPSAWGAKKRMGSIRYVSHCYTCSMMCILVVLNAACYTCFLPSATSHQRCKKGCTPKV